MIIILLTGLLLPGSAQAQSGCAEVRLCREDFMPKPNTQPDPAKVAVVQSLMDQAKTANDEEALRKQDLNRIRAGRRLDDKGMLREPDYLLALKKHSEAVKANFDAHNAAILKAVEVYELTPPNIDFTRDSRAALNNTSRSWLPRYSIREKIDQETGGPRRRNANELQDEESDGGVSAATTWDNGEISLFNQAFATPEELAITIYHETSHWIDGVAKTGGFRRSDSPAIRYRTEQVAYEHSAALARGLGVDATRFESLASRLGYQASQAEAENLRWDQVQILHPNWIMKTRPASYSLAAGPAGIERDDENVLQRGMEQAKSAVERSRQAREASQKNLEDERRQREKEEEERRKALEVLEDVLRRQKEWPEPVVARPEPPGPAVARPESMPVPARPVDLPPGEVAMRMIQVVAMKACSNPAENFDAVLAQIDWRESQRAQNLSPYTGWLSPCQLRVFNRLVDFGRMWNPGMRIGADDVRAAAAEPRSAPSQGGVIPPNQNHDPVWGKIGIPKR